MLSNAGGFVCCVAKPEFRCESNINPGGSQSGVSVRLKGSIASLPGYKAAAQPPTTKASVSRVMVEVNCTGDSR